MKRASFLTAAVVATVLLPLPAPAAQDCAGAITDVDRKLQKSQQRGDWNRIQVRLYIAEQFLAEKEPQKCLEAVQEAQAIAGLQVMPAAGQSGEGTGGPDQAKDIGPAGANIQGLDAEGWGTNEADTGSVPQEQ